MSGWRLFSNDAAAAAALASASPLPRYGIFDEYLRRRMRGMRRPGYDGQVGQAVPEQQQQKGRSYLGGCCSRSKGGI